VCVFYASLAAVVGCVRQGHHERDVSCRRPGHEDGAHRVLDELHRVRARQLDAREAAEPARGGPLLRCHPLRRGTQLQVRNPSTPAPQGRRTPLLRFYSLRVICSPKLFTFSVCIFGEAQSELQFGGLKVHFSRRLLSFHALFRNLSFEIVEIWNICERGERL